MVRRGRGGDEQAISDGEAMSAIEDLRKARWYIDREIANLERKP